MLGWSEIVRIYSEKYEKVMRVIIFTKSPNNFNFRDNQGRKQKLARGKSFLSKQQEKLKRRKRSFLKSFLVYI